LKKGETNLPSQPLGSLLVMTERSDDVKFATQAEK
jgi:hypothetical protein